MNGCSDTTELLQKLGLKPPEHLTLMITNGCNLRCSHCLPESGPQNHGSQVPTDILKRLIKEFSRFNGRTLCITGGEPLTHPNWFQLLMFAFELKQFKEIQLQTNGTLLTADTVETLASLKNSALRIQVSIEGITHKSHDRVRGKGSLKKTLDGLHLLRRAGLGDKTYLAFTETRHNFNELPQVLELVVKMDLMGLVSGTLVSEGRARHNDPLAAPTPDQYRELIHRFRTDEHFRDVYNRYGNISALEWFKNRHLIGNGCCDLIEKPYITADGFMYPCLMNRDREYAAPAVHQTSLENVIRTHAVKWSTLRKISIERSKKLEECRDCKGRLHCAGGCMGRAYSAHGDPMNVEDRCILRKSVYDILE